jgi:glycosyltransferase involved in cell wall biosynthesis
MRVLEISQQFPSREYPALGVMVRNAVEQIARWVQVEVLAPRPYTLPVPGFPYGRLAWLPDVSSERGYVVHRPRYPYLVPKRWCYPLVGPAYAWAVARYAPALATPALIHAHWAYPDGAGALALRARFDCPLVVHARGTLERVVARHSPRWRELVRGPLLAADAVIANSDALRADCLELGVAADRIRVIPNGVDLDLFTARDKAAARQELGLPAAQTLVLFCGNLRAVKGADLLGAAIPALLAARPSLSFALVGGGELAGSLRAALARELASGKVVMTGALPQTEVARWMNAADLLVLPSRSEARSNVIPEALACATAVAGARVGGVPEVVRPEHGVLFSPDSSAALGQAVLELTADPARLRAMGEAGRRFVLDSDLTWQAHARATLELYETLVR